MSSASGQWFRKTIDNYSEELSKSFTEAKARVQRGLEQLKLKNAETFRRIPSFRGSFRGSFRAGKKDSKKTKSAKKMKSPKKTLQSYSPPPEQSQSFPAMANDAEINATYRISRKKHTAIADQSFISSSGSDLDETERTLLSSTRRQPFNSSHSFPRISRSRKIENINIVFAKPFPPPSPRDRDGKPSGGLQTSTPKNRDLGFCHKEAFDMNNLRNVVAEIYAARKTAHRVRKPPRISRCRRGAILLDDSPASSPERHTSPEEDSSDPELAMSTDISFKSYDDDDDDDDEQPRTSPSLPISARANPELDDGVFWIPKKIFNLPRTSSRLSMQSKSSYGGSVGGGGRVSPAYSPIKNKNSGSENRPDQETQSKKVWGMTYNVAKDQKTARRLFSIDEAIVVDSGYSDRSGATSRATSSRATLYELQNRWRGTPSPSTSTTPSPTPPAPAENQLGLTRISESGPYVLKSFYV